MNRIFHQQRSRLKTVAYVAGLGAFYYCLARFGLRFSYEQSHASPVWPPAGLALAALLLIGTRVWPGIWLGAFAANTLLFIQNEGASLPSALWISAAIATGNTLEAVAGGWVWQRWLKLPPRQDKEHYFIEVANIFRYSAMAFVICLPSALIGTWAICAGGFAPWRQFFMINTIWWAGDITAVQLLTPFLLAWAHPAKLRWHLSGAVEGTAAFGMLATSIWAVFGGRFPANPLLYLTMTAMVWIAARQSTRAVTSALVILTTSSIGFTLYQQGPFAFPARLGFTSKNESILLLQVFLWVVALTFMALSSSVTALKKLAAELEERVQLRTAEAHRNLEHFLLFMQNMPGAAFIKDLAGKYIFANEQMKQLRGREPAECIGKSDHELWSKELADRIVAKDHQVIESGNSLRAVENVIEGDGPHELLMHRFALPDTQGRAEAVAVLAVDITDLKRTEKRLQEALDKEVILRREINHRVKNNLQVISSLLYLQSMKIQDTNVREILRESQSRVRSLSLIYERLCQPGKAGEIKFTEYVQELAKGLFVAYQARPEMIALKISIEEVPLDLDTAMPCGMILTELISNALKHAFPGSRKGELSIDLHIQAGRVCMTVHDNGIGLPDGFHKENSDTMGMDLVRDLTNQLNGQFEFQCSQGTTATINFPAPGS